MTTKKNSRRRFLAAGLPALAVGAPAAVAAQTSATSREERRFFRPSTGNPPPPYSPEVAYGNLLFISGKGVGVGFQGDITAQVTKTLDNVEESLRAAGSSMQKVLKVNVYLADIRHFDAMNAIYRARFGPVFPTRTTIGGAVLPDGGLVEIDCVAYI
jgi:2-iminobutanoate/2-iminopropanoate deaminase